MKVLQEMLLNAPPSLCTAKCRALVHAASMLLARSFWTSDGSVANCSLKGQFNFLFTHTRITQFQ